MTTPLQEAYAKLDVVPEQTRIEVIRGVTVRRKINGLTVMSIHYSAIPDRDPSTEKGLAWYRHQKKKYSSEARWKKEQEMDAYAAGGEAVFGKILSDYYEDVVISDPYWYPDPRWDVIGGFDHGGTNATCLLKAYIPRETINPVTGKKNPPEVIIAGEYYSYRRDGWQNNVDQNVRLIVGVKDSSGNYEVEPMPDMDRARWIAADRAIFYNDQQQEKGAPTSIYEKTYKKNGMFPMVPYEGVRSDVTFVEWMMSDYWRGVANGEKPRLRIVCRNPSDRPQPGLHPYDCPNLLWELKRAKRVEMTARQLLTKNASEMLTDKSNHARDALKYITGMLRNPTAIPLHEGIEDAVKGLDALTAGIRRRFLMSQAAMTGKLGPDGQPKKGRPSPVVDLRRRPGVIR